MRTLHLMFIDNPFLIKALRARRHGGKIYLLPVLLVLLGLLGIGATFELARRFGELHSNFAYYMQTFDAIYLTAVMGTVLILAVTAASQGMVQEVVSGTLEFQRLTTLTVRQIVLGKAVGEPIVAYLVIFATFPILVITTLLGGYPLRYKLMAVLLSLTTTFCMACMATIIPVRSVEKSGKGWSPVAGLLFGFGWFLLPVVVAAQADGMIGFLVGLVLPLPFVVELWLGDLFSRSIALFGSVQVIIDFVTPFAQVLLGLLAATMAARLLRQDERPPIHRVVGYLIAVVLSIAYAALVRSPGIPTTLESSCVYPLGLSAMVLIVFLLSVPDRDGYKRWIWRDSEKETSILRYLYADRSPGWMALTVYAFIVAWASILFLVANPQWPAVYRQMYEVAAITGFLSLVAYGAVAHAVSLAFGRVAVATIVLCEVAFLVVGLGVEFVLHGYITDAPHDWNTLTGMSLPLFFAVLFDALRWTDAGDIPWMHLSVFVVVRLALLVLAVAFIAWWTPRCWRRILVKKRSMGVLPEQRDGGPMMAGPVELAGA